MSRRRLLEDVAKTPTADTLEGTKETSECILKGPGTSMDEDHMKEKYKNKPRRLAALLKHEDGLPFRSSMHGGSSGINIERYPVRKGACMNIPEDVHTTSNHPSV